MPDPEVQQYETIPKRGKRLDDLLEKAIRGRIEPRDPTSAEDLRKAMAKVRRETEYCWEPQPLVVHPEHYRKALRLLGLPYDHHLTNSEFMEAAGIESEVPACSYCKHGEQQRACYAEGKAWVCEGCGTVTYGRTVGS